MKTNMSKSLKMSDDEEEELKNCDTNKGGSGKRRTTRNESEKRRRDKLNIYITELASMVPACTSSLKKLDKTTILKMTVNYMRVHNDLTASVLSKECGLHMSFLSSDDVADLLYESLNGFLFVLSNLGEVVYSSKNITPLLGFEVDQIIGKKFIDIVHPDDKSKFLFELNEDSKSCIIQSDFNGFHKINNKPEKHSFNIRIRCASNKHFNDSQDPYERIHVFGYTDNWETTESPEDTETDGKIFPRKAEESIAVNPRCLVAVGLLVRPGCKRFASSNESTSIEFQSRHTMAGKFLFVDTRSITLTGFWPCELLGTSLYSYVHHDDMEMLASVHQLLLKYGECKTEPYRMRTKGEQWLWITSRSFISYNHWNSKPEFFYSTNIVVCNNVGVESLRERKNRSLCSAQQVYPSIASIRDNRGCFPYQSQQEPLNTMPRLTMEQENAVKTDTDCKDSVNDLSNSNIPTSAHSPRELLSEGSESHHKSDGDGETAKDITDSLDLTMSYEELESFIEAQGQLHDQLLMKHTLLEKTIAKQKHQLQAVQQQMLLNLQAQLTINPGENQEIFEEQLKKTKNLSEMRDKQEGTHKELVQTLKERRKQTEKRNRKQLKYFLEKKSKVKTDFANDASSLSQASHTTTTTDVKIPTTSETLNDNSVKLIVIEEKQSLNSSSNQVESIFEENRKQDPVLQVKYQKLVQYFDAVSRQDSHASDARQHVAEQFRASSGIAPISGPKQHDGLRGFLPSQQIYHEPQETISQKTRGFSTRGISNPSNINQYTDCSSTSNIEESPSTLSNIQSLLTASSQNPQSMQKLMSGLSSKPDLAQTLLSMLKQAQTSGSNEQDSLLFDQSLQKTTNHFSAALGTNVIGDDNAQIPYQCSNNIANVQGLQKQQESLEEETRTFSINTEKQMMQDTTRTRSSKSSFRSTSSWSGETSAAGLPFLHDTGRDQEMATMLNEKQKDNKKDYFSNFTSQELEDMFLTNSSAKSPKTNTQATNSVEEAKLQEEQLLHSPLLIQQQQLLQMHQDQRKQLLLRQQEQLLMISRQNPEQTEQQMPISLAENNQQDSFRSLFYHNNHSSTSTKEQEQQPSTSNTVMQQLPESWDPLSSNNFELNEADEQVLNLLLAESSMDTLLDPSPWPETDSLLEYLNMNPDLTSD